jgi:ABC-type polysaccharide/polyol phosphate export permease
MASPATAAPVDRRVRVDARDTPTSPRKEILFRRRVGLASAARELWRYRELVLTLAERDLRVRYKQAVLGLAWALLTPLLLLGAFSLVFTRFTHVSTLGVPYALFSAVGLVPWTFFSTAFSRGGISLVSNIPLLNKLYCPREVFPLASIALATVDAIAAGLVVLLMFPLTGYAPHVEMMYAPLLLLVLLLFTAGVTLITSAILVHLRDLQVLLPLIVQFGLFVTPVAYGAETVVKSTGGQVIYAVLNPLAPVIDGLRRGILLGEAPLLLPSLAGAASAVVVALVGFVLFKRLETGLADIA